MKPTRRNNQRGFTLTELMVGMTIGLIVLGGVTSAYVSSAKGGRDAQSSAEQVENGRQALEFISYDLRHAGYFGHLANLPVAGAALPNPCETANLAAMFQAMAFPVQAYDAPAASPIACLNNLDHVAGTDVLVVRRVASESLAVTDVADAGAIYLQANPLSGELQIGDGVTVISTTKKANGAAATILNRDGVTAAPIHRYLVHIYFIAPCTVPDGGGANCTGANDDDGNPIPALKRLELTAAGGATQLSIVPLVSGIENIQFDYGIDNLPATVDPITGLMGDGAPDCMDTDPGSGANAGVTAGCATANPGAVVEWTNVVRAQAHVLARSYRSDNSYTDNKTYDLGLGLNALTPGGGFRRHAYSTAVRFTNIGGRRELPL